MTILLRKKYNKKWTENYLKFQNNRKLKNGKRSILKLIRGLKLYFAIHKFKFQRFLKQKPQFPM